MNFKACSAVVSAFAMSLMLAACGSDDNSSNVERGDDDSSSSVEETSSSSTKGSSSSKNADTPKETRAATLDDLQKNMSLGDLFGTEAFLATGSKQGLFSLWIEDPVPAWIAVHSDFEDGVIKISDDYGSYTGYGSDNYDKMEKFFNKTAELKFIVNEKDQLQVSVNGGKYKDVESVSVDKEPNVIWEASELQDVKLSCKSDDLEQTYSFYKGRYLVEEKIGDSTNWSMGYYDIQRGYLLMLPTYYENSVIPIVSAELDKKFNMTILDEKSVNMDCSKSSLSYKDVDPNNLVGSWVSYVDNEKWSFKLDSLGSFTIELTQKKVPQEQRDGEWEIYGDQLLLRHAHCSVNRTTGKTCNTIVRGSVEKLDPKKGFTYKHNEDSSLPTEWSLPEYE